MKSIKLKPYILDTKDNLEKVTQKFTNSSINFVDFMKFVKSDTCEKIVTLIGGSQISGSLSPFMHTYSSFLNKNPFLYILFNMLKENTNLKEVFDLITQNENILGSNVTMPYKIEIFEILEKLGNLDSSARLVGAVNTLAKIDGKVIGFNTDMFGIINPITEKLGKELQNINKGYVIGAGGASRAAVAGLLKLGIQDITMFNRTDMNMINLVNHFNSREIKNILKEEGNNNFCIKMIEYDVQNDEKFSISEHFDKKGILINTLPFGFKSHLPKYSIREEEFEKINKNIALFFDVVYDLNYKHTPIVEYIKNNHPEIIICDGIDMVVEQAKKGFEMWTGGNVLDGDKIKGIFR